MVFLGGPGVRYEERPPHPARRGRIRWRGRSGRAPTSVPIGRGVGYGERQVRRRILAATEHAPKRLMRIARMQRLLLDGRGESWARSAVEHGYYDEAHMANDVREPVGATPHALVGRPILPSENRAASVPSS